MELYGGVLEWGYPWIILFNGIFYYKRTILGIPIYGNPHILWTVDEITPIFRTKFPTDIPVLPIQASTTNASNILKNPQSPGHARFPSCWSMALFDHWASRAQCDSKPTLRAASEGTHMMDHDGIGFTNATKIQEKSCRCFSKILLALSYLGGLISLLNDTVNILHSTIACWPWSIMVILSSWTLLECYVMSWFHNLHRHRRRHHLLVIVIILI